jgi:DNA-binding winged helix-turn-helix (wHTH) protein
MEGVTMRYFFGEYLLDIQRHELSRAGEPIPLRPKVFQALAHLLAHRDRVVRKQELLDHLWPGQLVADTSLNSYIMAVRKAIGDQRSTPQLLRTVRGNGYRFVTPVQVQEPVPPADRLPSGPFSKEPSRLHTQIIRSPPGPARPPTPPASMRLPPLENTSRSPSCAAPCPKSAPAPRDRIRSCGIA